MSLRILAAVLVVSITATALPGVTWAQQPTPPPTPATGQPPAQQPVFRARIDLLSVDATVVDRDGRQVTDMAAGEFVVEVDGRPRPVVSAEYVKLGGDSAAVPAARPVASADASFFSTNAQVGSTGRQVLLLVDEGNIRTGEGRLAMRSAAKFVDSLAPSDRVAMIAIPRGTLVDFTAEHERVREALLATIGRASPFKGRFHMSLSEAIATHEHSDVMLRTQLVLRECAAVLGNPVEAARCEVEVEQEAGEFVNHQRQQTQMSLLGMREVLRSLSRLDGPKSVILISEGLVLEGLGSDVDDIAAVASDVRASLDVLLLDVSAVDASQASRPSTPREDRDRQVEGLESLAGLARGSLHRVVSSADQAFTRVLRSIAGHYLIAVEAVPADRDGKRHRISVKTNRRGVTLLSRRGFLASTSPAATSPTDAVTRALRAPLTMNDVPMRVATWTYKEPGGNKVRLLVTAEVERQAEQSLDYTTGLLLVDKNNRAVATPVARQTLRAGERNPGAAIFAASLLVDPGSYLLRFAAADNEGRLGSIERRFDAWQMNTPTLSVGDLLVGAAAAPGGPPLVPSIEPVVDGGRLVALMEVYQANLSTANLQGTLEVVSDEQSRPLLTAALPVQTGPSPEVGLLQGVLDTSALPPGRYLARASVRQDGKAQGHLVRPFVVAPASASPTSGGAAAASSVPSRVPADVVAALVNGLPNVDRKALLTPAVLGAALGRAEQTRPAAKAAFALARSGSLGKAALEALGSGDQAAAAFLRGVELLEKGDDARALQQLQLAMQQAPTWAPLRLYLGAALASNNRHREAAPLLGSAGAELAALPVVAQLAAVSWLRAGEAGNAVAALEGAKASGDGGVLRSLSLAYLASGRHAEALPLLQQQITATPDDADLLLASIYATYALHIPSAQADRLATDRTQVEAWATRFRARKGAQQGLVDAWVRYLRELK